jgi:diguanylate cyclase (GGDEF)-like protein
MLAVIADNHISQLPLVILDASVLSLVAIGVINQLFKNGLLVLHRHERLKYIAFDIGIIVFTIEAVIMLSFELLPLNLNTWQLGLVDVFALSFFSVVFIRFLILKPTKLGVFSHKTESKHFEPIIISSILAYICFAIILLVGLLASYQKQFELKRQDIEELEVTELKRAKVAFLDRLNNTSRDLLIYSHDSDIQPLLNGSSHAQNSLEINYRHILAIKDYYAQIRVLNTQGKEVIRVQRNESMIKITPQQQLQDKSDRYYYKESIKLQVGEIYISPLDLNVEQGVIELPLNPMIRIATPIVDEEGKKAGIIIINLCGNYLLSKLQSTIEKSSGKVMLLNSESYWLFGGDSKTNWAFMFDDKLTMNFQQKYPDVWKKIIYMQSGKIQSKFTNTIVKHIEFNPASITDEFSAKPRVQYNERHWPIWKLVSIIFSKQITEKLNQTQKSLTIIYFGILFVAACGTILLAHAMITSRKYQLEVKKQAFYDHLTDLCNTRLFTKIMEQEFTRSKRDSTGLALMYFDLDYFKVINDELGHKAGDEALKEAAIRLENCLRECDTVARIGGDEFAALLPRPGNLHDIMDVAERIIESFRQPFELLGHRRNLGISIGIAISRRDNENYSTLTQRADNAMYEAKRDGRNCFKFS